MKIRNGFISNSSSSSFVVIGNEPLKVPKMHSAYLKDYVLQIPQTFEGTYDFDYQAYTDFADKLNWAALMCWFKESPTGFDNSDTVWTDMLCKVIKDNIRYFTWVKINFRYTSDFLRLDENDNTPNDGYIYCDTFIDHESIPNSIDHDSAKMFESEDTLTRFLFAPDSSVYLKYD